MGNVAATPRVCCRCAIDVTDGEASCDRSRYLGRSHNICTSNVAHRYEHWSNALATSLGINLAPRAYPNVRIGTPLSGLACSHVLGAPAWWYCRTNRALAAAAVRGDSGGGWSRQRCTTRKLAALTRIPAASSKKRDCG